MMAATFFKDPAALLDFAVEWAAWLGDDTISAAGWTVPAGLTKEAESATATKATVWLAGGTAGQSYEVVNHIVTAGGREDERTLVIRCVER